MNGTIMFRAKSSRASRYDGKKSPIIASGLRATRKVSKSHSSHALIHRFVREAERRVSGTRQQLCAISVIFLYHRVP
jgi:hypothetical protein